MKKSEWSDDDIETLLKKLPIVKSSLSKQEVFTRVDNRMRRKRKLQTIMSIGTTAAVLLLTAILLQSLFFNRTPNQNQASQKVEPAVDEQPITSNEDDQQSREMIKKNEKAITESNLENNKDQSKIQTYSSKVSPAFISSNEDSEIISIGIPDLNFNYVIPVSFAVPKNVNWLDFWQAKMAEINEDEYGLEEFLPISADFEWDEEKRFLTVNLPKKHSYNTDTGARLLFDSLQILADSINIQKVVFKTDGTEGVEFNSFGVKTELSPLYQRAYLMYQSSPEKPQLLVASQGSYSSVKEAIDSMYTLQGITGIFPSIPQTLQYTSLTEIGKGVIIKLADNAVLADEPTYSYALTAILMTAKEFGKESVTFDNASINQVGAYDLTKPIKVPIAINLQLNE